MSLKPDQIKRFIETDDSIREMIREVEKYGGELNRNKLSTSQIRNAYGTMKKLEMLGWSTQTERQLLLLKPRLAYAAERHGGAVKDLKEVISTAIDSVKDDLSFKRFCEFFEAIVAYHRASGGK